MYNDEQLRVINHTYGPAAVLSGAGSGKTHTLVGRIEKLAKVTNPNRIVTLTFTNAAAEEMKLRAAKINESCKDVYTATYHKFCSSTLRKYGKAIGIYPSFEGLNKSKYSTFVEYVKSSNEYYDSLNNFPSASKLVDIFSIVTNTDTTIEEAVRDKKYSMYAEDIQNLFYEVKKAGLEQQKLCFDDMLVYMNKLLENESICKKIANSFDFLMVDEFQDTNDLQLQMLVRLSKYNENIVIVGDISQSIYKFRGAKVQNIQKFIDSFDICNTYSLTTNYRSTQEILDAANDVMNHNVRSWKYVDMVSNNKHGDLPIIKHHRDDYDQTGWIINKINDACKNGYDLSQIAIIERKSMSSFRLENELLKANIPFAKFGGQKLTDSMAVNEILAFLSVVVRKSDKFNWFDVLKLVPGIGSKTATDISKHCNDPDFPTPYKKRKFYPDLEELLHHIHTYGTLTSSLSSILEDIAEYYFLLKTAKAEKARTSSAKYDALDKINREKAVISVLIDMSKHYSSAIEFLNDIALDSVKNSDETGDRLVITTIHSAKGLEWPITILIDCVEDFKNDIDEEEELRCLYVEMTRAEEEMIISISDMTVLNREPIYNEISHFLTQSLEYFNVI